MKKTVKMMIAVMLCGIVMVACGGGADYTGTYEAEILGLKLGMTLNADGTATAITNGEVKTGYSWEAAKQNGKVVITYGTKRDDGQFTSNQTAFIYEDGKLVNGEYIYTKRK
jgi:major membrane immunogen (membrane-anchored lipoprotein)